MNYLNYWKLKDKPFESTRNSKFFFPSHNHAEALERLLYIIRDRNMNFGVLTGEIGSGKTITKTILEHQLLKENFEVVSIENACFPFHPILIEIVSQLKKCKVNMKEHDEYAAINMLKEHLVKIVIEKNNHLVILMDEAQQLEKACLDKLKNLTNISSEGENYMTIILIGQPELKATIRSLPQLDQRVSLRYHLKHLPVDEIRDYVNHRLKVAGCNDLSIFTDEAIRTLYKVTHGIPREINRLCRLALDSAFSVKHQKISESIVISISKDINLQSSTSDDLGKIDPLYSNSSNVNVYETPENNEGAPDESVSEPVPELSEDDSSSQGENISEPAAKKILVLDDSSPDSSLIFNDLSKMGYPATFKEKKQGVHKDILKQSDLIIVVINFKKVIDRKIFRYLIPLKDIIKVPILIATEPPLSKTDKARLSKFAEENSENILFFPFMIEELKEKVETLLSEQEE